MKRTPDDVPTPIAVAVADFCRRARSPAPPAEVRDALALLSPDEDFRARTLADTEPEATPLGPYAVVDILNGTPPSLAAQRQSCGYYELARELLAARASPAVPGMPPVEPPPSPEARATPAAPQPVSAEATPATTAKTHPPTLGERIAPRKRSSQAAEPTAAAPLSPESPAAPRRELPAPRGRFTRLSTQKLPASELLKGEARETLAGQMLQHSHRLSLLRALAGEYTGKDGRLALAELEAALAHHGLLEELERKERDAVLAAYTEHKGASGRVAWALGVSPAELQKLVQALSLTKQVAELRERYKREALAAQPLVHRLDLLGRTKYLDDLGVRKRFMESLTGQLRQLLRGSLPEASSLPELIELTAKKHGAPTELLARAMDRLGLSEELRKQVSQEAATHLP